MEEGIAKYDAKRITRSHADGKRRTEELVQSKIKLAALIPVQNLTTYRRPVREELMGLSVKVLIKPGNSVAAFMVSSELSVWGKVRA